MRFRVFLAFFVVVFAIGILVFLKYKPTGLSNNSLVPKPAVSIVTSFYPLYFFTSQIVGPYATVTNITPPGLEPHEYELTPRDVALMEKSELILVNGGNLEPWAENIAVNLQHKPETVVYTAQGLFTRTIDAEEKNQIDPHVWLDPSLAKQQVEQISRAVIARDPEHTQEYLNNTQRLKQQLDELDTEFSQSLGVCKRKDIVTSHAAFGYLADRYGLYQVSLSGLSPDQEPSPKELAGVVTFSREHNVKYIFFETLVSPRLAETLANEIGAGTLVFNPLEGLTQQEQNDGMDYFSVQRKNLQNIKIALECI